MLENKALYYYKKGYNCSQCVLKACESVYNIPISKQSLKLCSAVNTGFGIGNICSVLVAGIMVLGLLFSEEDSKRLRIKFLNQFQETFGNLNCSYLRGSSTGGCEHVIGKTCNMLEKIIKEEYLKN